MFLLEIAWYNCFAHILDRKGHVITSASSAFQLRKEIILLFKYILFESMKKVSLIFFKISQFFSELLLFSRYFP